MRKLFLVVIVCLVALVISAGATAAGSVPLPNDVTIIPPDSTLPPEIKEFSGKWGAAKWWDPAFPGGMDAMLIVERVGVDKIDVVYGWGDSSEWSISKDWRRIGMTLSRDENQNIKFSCPLSRSRTFEIRLVEGKLKGTVSGSRSTAYITMSRLD